MLFFNNRLNVDIKEYYEITRYILIKHTRPITYFINWFICHVLFIT